MKYQVVVAARAACDVQSIYDWLAERSPSGAKAWYQAWNIALDSLEGEPLGFAVAVESPRRNFTIREAYFRTRKGRTYRILFTIVDVEVRVLHVLGPAQLFPDDLA